MVNFRRDIRLECGFCQSHVSGSERAEDVSIGICGPCRERILAPLGLENTVFLGQPAERGQSASLPVPADRTSLPGGSTSSDREAS